MLDRYDDSGRLRYTGRTTTLGAAVRHALADQLRTGDAGHPWTGRTFTAGWASWEQLSVHLVVPEVVAEVAVDLARDSAGLNEIDPGWAPEGWEIGWQRAYRLLLAHVQAGGALPAGPGDVVVQGEDLGVWIAGQVAGWDRLVPVQQYLLETVGVYPDGVGVPVVPARRSQDELWERNMTAARQFHAREGHLQVPRHHREGVDGELLGLGSFVANARRRAAKLSPERRDALNALGMRW
ncbi:Helicase associated domain protein [Streptomyces sp. NPDC020489]|uniref:Helicase associated domain protein n=1 Tax=Streptomyces sp. NPDC020489 TaxID=3365077 RepID=UPI0037B98FE5